MPAIQKLADAAKMNIQDTTISPFSVARNLALLLFEHARTGDTDFFMDVFEVVEETLIYGDSDDQKLVLVGLLEELKNICSVNDYDYAVFEQWLGPESHVAWRWLEKKWQGRQSLAEAFRKRISNYE